MSKMNFDTTNGTKKAIHQSMMECIYARTEHSRPPMNSRRTMRHKPYSNDYYQMRREERAFDEALAQVNEQSNGGGAE